MDSTHVHLILNHFPIVGSLIATALLLYGYTTKNNSIQKASLVTLVVLSVIAIPVFLTGNPAKEAVENLPGVTESVIEQHEEAAEVAFWIMMVAGAMSVLSVATIFLKPRMARKVIMATLLVSLVSSILMIRTGYLGGQIRHTEIRGVTQAGSSNELPKQEEED